LLVIAFAGIVIVVGLAGCRNPFFRPTPVPPPIHSSPGQTDADKAVQAVSAYVTALQKGDYNTAYGMLSRDSQSLHTAASFEQQGKKGMPLYDLQKATATITGETALVEVQQLEDPATHGFQLVRENDAWKIVYRGGIPGSPDPE
jgi:phage/plasmid primase-like uncharacterized protein